MQERYGVAINNKLVVVAPCTTDIVIDLNNEMVLVAIPCKINIGHGAWFQLQDEGPTKRTKDLEQTMGVAAVVEARSRSEVAMDWGAGADQGTAAGRGAAAGQGAAAGWGRAAGWGA